MFKDILKELLNEQQLSQRDLARGADIPPATISGWLNYGKLPDYTAIKKLSKFFDVTPEYILEMSDDYWGNVTLSAGAISGNNNTVNSHNTINSAAPTTPDEAELLRLWKKAPPDKRAALLKLLQ